MTVTARPARTDPAAAPQVVPGPSVPGPPPRRRPGAALLWAALCSKRTGVVLLLVLGVLTLVGTVLPQVPDDVVGNPQAQAEWLVDRQARFGPWTSVLARVGAFDVFASVWFLTAAGLLCLGLVASTVQRLPQLWHTAAHPNTRAPDRLWTHAAASAQVVVAPPVATPATTLAAGLRARRYRVVQEAGEGRVWLLADRFRFTPLATVLTHGALLFIVAGVVLSSRGGFSDPSVSVPVGSSVALGHSTGLTLTARGFTDAYYDTGAPKDFASDVVLTRAGVPVASATVRPNHPLSLDGVVIHQAAFGNAADLRVVTADGRSREVTIPMRWRSADGALTFGRLALAGQDAEIFVGTASAGRRDALMPAGLVRLDVTRPSTGQTAGSALLEPRRARTVAGLTVTLLRERQYTEFLVSRDPGGPWVWTGALLLVAGLALTIYLRPRRIWALVEPHEDAAQVRLACAERSDRWFAALVADLCPPDPASATDPVPGKEPPS